MSDRDLGQPRPSRRSTSRPRPAPEASAAAEEVVDGRSQPTHSCPGGPPDWACEVRSRLSGLRLSPAREAEIVEELSQHLEDRRRDLLAAGFDPAAARLEALRDFTGSDVLAKRLSPLKQSKWAGRADWDGMVGDVWLAARRLRKHSAATLAAVATLAFAIGAAAATWSLLTAVLLYPLPVAEPDRLMVVGWAERGSGAGRVNSRHRYTLYPAVRDSGIFEGVAAGGDFSVLVGSDERPVRTPVYFANRDYFRVLGVKVALGRDFAPEDDRRGAPLVALLSDRYWRRSFDTDPAVLGRTLLVAGKPTTIIGVVARGFRGLDLSSAPDIYMPLHTVADVGTPLINYFAEPLSASVTASPTSWVTVVGRLRSDSTADETAARLTALAERPDTRRPSPPPVLTPINTAAIPATARAGTARFSRLLATTVGLLLLIGCATVGMLLLIRTEARRGEFALAMALGASRARLARGVMMEGALLAFAGGCLALPVAGWLFEGVRAFQLPGGIGIDLLELSVDTPVLMAAAACALAATLVISLVAARLGFAANLSDALRGRSAATPATTGRRTRALLVAGQVAVAMVLLAGSGLFGRSIVAALSVNPGVDTTRIVTGDLSLRPYGYTPERATRFFETLRERLDANPTLGSASVSTSQGGMSSRGKLTIDGEPRSFPSMVSFTAIDQAYFETMGVGAIEGRTFTEQDRAGTTLVAVVSESFGRMLANGGSPIGHRITMPVWRPGQPADVLEVVGVVPDLITDLRALEPLDLYLPIAQTSPVTHCTLVMRAATDANAARREAMSAIRQLDASVTPFPMLTLDERLADQMTAQRFGAVVMGALGFIAILLTVLGAYVLAESMTVSRWRELAIRASLGARRWQLGLLVVSHAGRLVAVGLAAGLGLAWALANTIRAFLFGVEPLDGPTLAAVAALILVSTMAMALRPGLRATRVDLTQALREE